MAFALFLSLQSRGLCTLCRHMAEKLAATHQNPDHFRLHVGSLSSKIGHERTHEALINAYKITFDAVPIDPYFKIPLFV